MVLALFATSTSVLISSGVGKERPTSSNEFVCIMVECKISKTQNDCYDADRSVQQKRERERVGIAMKSIDKFTNFMFLLLLFVVFFFFPFFVFEMRKWPRERRQPITQPHPFSFLVTRTHAFSIVHCTSHTPASYFSWVMSSKMHQGESSEWLCY